MKRNFDASASLIHHLHNISVTDVPVKLAAVQDEGTIDSDVLETLLSAEERDRAARFTVVDERRHYLFRRCFQRLFVALVAGGHSVAEDILLVHALDQRPYCPDHPGLCLSFSSSGSTYVFGATETGKVGVDVERLRHVDQADALAERFFSSAEAALFGAFPQGEKSRHFLTVWSAKEAALKASGKGIDSGLNTFTFHLLEGRWQIGAEDNSRSDALWQLVLPRWRDDHVVAVMHSSRV